MDTVEIAPGSHPEALSEPPAEGGAAPVEQPVKPPNRRRRSDISPIEGPVWVAWREGTLTRAKELEALAAWVRSRNRSDNDEILDAAIGCHLRAAREAATVEPLNPRRRFKIFRNGPLIERAASNLDAAEAHILNVAPADYVLGQMPCLLRHVQVHLPATDPGRQEFERIARSVGVGDPDRPTTPTRTNGKPDHERRDREQRIDDDRGKIVTAVRAASSAALRERVRLRSFRNIVVVTAALMALLAIGVALLVMGWVLAGTLAHLAHRAGEVRRLPARVLRRADAGGQPARDSRGDHQHPAQ